LPVHSSAGGKRAVKRPPSGSLFQHLSVLAFDFSVDKQNNQRTDDRDGKAAKVETINFAKAEQRTDPTTDDRADNPQYHGDDKPTAIFARHNPLRQDTRNQPKDKIPITFLSVWFLSLNQRHRKG
jgi:hypothetical protein